jgi:hypothetical protein
VIGGDAQVHAALLCLVGLAFRRTFWSG